MAGCRTLWAAVAVLAVAGPARTQTYPLAEAPKPGECFRVRIDASLTGALKVQRDDKPAAIKLSASSGHAILERILSAPNGAVRKVARYYEKAQSTITIGEDRVERSLRDDRKLIVAQRNDEALLCYSPAGPLTRTELEVTAEHFDTLALTGILPGKGVALDESWKLSNATVQALCLFEGLVSHDLTAKLKEVKDGAAVIAIEGKASGIETGALANLTITATARYDLLSHRLTDLEWKQKDVRDQGPASPAIEVETSITLKRSLLTEEPKELTEVALVGVPKEETPPGLLVQLSHRDPKGRYQFLYGREWHVVGQTDIHLVLRLIDRGDFIAQATLTPWKSLPAGKHVTPDEFKQAVSETPGWQMEEIIDSAEVPTDPGRWAYRITARGETDGVKVVQSFYVIAGPEGDHVVVTFTAKPSNLSKIGTRDAALVNAIEFLKK